MFFFLFKIQKNVNDLLLYLLISSPIFILGFLEDITQAVSPILRLFGACLSALLFFLVYRITIKNTGFEFIDNILNYDSISIIFTLICIIFLTQSFNIIDGLNGLSLSSSILAFCSIILIASE